MSPNISANNGSSLGYGASVNHHDIFATDHNPATGAFIVDDDEKWRFNLLGSVSAQYELGDVNNFADELDELIDILDDPNSSTAPVNETLDRFNALLIDMGDNGYIHTQTNIRVLPLPASYRLEKYSATITVDAQIQTNISARVLDDELKIINEEFVTSSSLYLKSAIEKYIAVNYALPVYSLNNNAEIYVGAKLKLINLELSKQVSSLQSLDGNNIDDVIKDQYDNNLKSSTGLSLDVGIILEADKYRLGLTVFDLNSPSFNYGDIGIDCDRFEDPSDNRTSCEVAAFFTNEKREISAREKHTKHARTSIFASYKITNKWWVNSALDLASYENSVGLEDKHVTLSSSYNPTGSIFSAFRIAYETNKSRKGLDAIAIGFTFFKSLGLDAIYGLDNIESDGSKGPRKFGLSLSITEQF